MGYDDQIRRADVTAPVGPQAELAMQHIWRKRGRVHTQRGERKNDTHQAAMERAMKGSSVKNMGG